MLYSVETQSAKITKGVVHNKGGKKIAKNHGEGRKKGDQVKEL